MRRHLTVRLVAVLLFVASFILLVIGIVGALIVGGGGLGAGWGIGWRGWLWIPWLVSGVLGSISLLLLGAVLFFLAKIDHNLTTARSLPADKVRPLVSGGSPAASGTGPAREYGSVTATEPFSAAAHKFAPPVSPETPVEEAVDVAVEEVIEVAAPQIESEGEYAQVAERVAAALTVEHAIEVAPPAVKTAIADAAEEAELAVGVAVEETIVAVPAEVEVATTATAAGAVEEFASEAEVMAGNDRPVMPEVAETLEAVAPSPEEVAPPVGLSPAELETQGLETEFMAPQVAESAVLPDDSLDGEGSRGDLAAGIVEATAEVSVAVEEEEPVAALPAVDLGLPSVELGAPEVLAPEPEPVAPTPLVDVAQAEIDIPLEGAPVEDSPAKPSLADEESGAVEPALAGTRSKLPGADEIAQIAAELQEIKHPQRPAAEPASMLPESPADFTLIRGIGPGFALRLQEGGIRTFGDLANASDEDLDRLTEWPIGQAVRDGWREQARRLAGR